MEKFILTAIIGGVIGYITNWIAIKMIFRPHKEKYLFGKKVPFTPGLIVKEKARIANKIGESVEENLLTKETLEDILVSDEIIGEVAEVSRDVVEGIIKENPTIEESIELIFGNDSERIKEDINRQVIELAWGKVESESTRLFISKLVSGYIDGMVNENPNIIVESDFYKEISRGLVERVKSDRDENRFREVICSYIDKEILEYKNSDKTLEEVLPEEVIEVLKEYIKSNEEKICSTLSTAIQTEESRAQLGNIIDNAIKTKMNPFVARMIDLNMILDLIISSVTEFLETEENQEKVSEIAVEVVNGILRGKVSNIADSLTIQQIEEISGMISDKVFNDDIINSFEVHIDDYIRSKESVRDIVESISGDIIPGAKITISNKIYEVISSNLLKAYIEEGIVNATEEVYVKNIGDIIEGKESTIIGMSSSKATEMYIKVISTYAGRFVSKVELSKIIEKQVMSYGEKELEELILKICKKELNAITRFGALIGSVMGIISQGIATIF